MGLCHFICVCVGGGGGGGEGGHTYFLACFARISNPCPNLRRELVHSFPPLRPKLYVLLFQYQSTTLDLTDRLGLPTIYFDHQKTKTKQTKKGFRPNLWPNFLEFCPKILTKFARIFPNYYIGKCIPPPLPPPYAYMVVENVAQ